MVAGSYLVAKPGGGYKTLYTSDGDTIDVTRPKTTKVSGTITKVGPQVNIPVEQRLEGAEVRTEIEIEEYKMDGDRPLLRSGIRVPIRKRKHWVLGRFDRGVLFEEVTLTSTQYREDGVREQEDELRLKRGTAYRASVKYRH